MNKDTRTCSNQILVIYNPEKAGAVKLSSEIRDYLESKEISNAVCCSKSISEDFFGKKHRLIITLGGDGTVLYCSRLFSPYNTPILAINFGEIGFITETEKNEWKSALESFLNNTHQLIKHIHLKASVFRENEKKYEANCLNDSVITANGAAKLINLKVYVENLYLGRYKADGIIVSTPTGSTAYSAAAGGPLLYPEIDAFILTPICPYSLTNRAIVLPVDKEIKIVVEKDQRVDIVLTTDGQEVFKLKEEDTIIIEKSHYITHIIKAEKDVFFSKVKTKLNWSGGPNNA
ncbi:MAG: NAD(+)/NADH kinase [Spirochaetes bacterium]|nr:NAD(+)/NADH kinase [Spirochaetota bacterium]